MKEKCHAKPTEEGVLAHLPSLQGKDQNESARGYRPGQLPPVLPQVQGCDQGPLRPRKHDIE